ncbi:MAG: signal peptidase I [Ruminococcaceae bacterium]|nr:signal peptidase I [Oscillospiraceae bacterium]
MNENDIMTNTQDTAEENTHTSKEKTSFSASIYEAFSVVMSSVFIIALVFTFGFRLVGVSGTSMINTLQNKDWLIVTPYYSEPEYGDIVISTHRLDTMGPIVKRVIATEGDEVNITEDGSVYVNGEKLDETSYTVPVSRRYGDRTYPVTVPENHVMLMGDNRPMSSDSRYTSVGFAPVDALLGKAQIRLSGEWNIYYNFEQ